MTGNRALQRMILDRLDRIDGVLMLLAEDAGIETPEAFGSAAVEVPPREERKAASAVGEGMEEQEAPEVELDATSSALELAAENDLDLEPYAGQGSGPDGRIWKEDVEGWLVEASE